MINLVGLDRAEIAAALVAAGEPDRSARMRANQLWHWLYHRGARSFAEMTSISKDLRARLADSFTVARGEVVRDQRSVDGTAKWLLRLPDGNEVESVYIPEEDRGALCVSSQVGCTLTCKFCHTGTQKLVRNLTAAEIVAQVLTARDLLGEWPTPTGDKPRMLSNIVMMGMGEPLYNYENVAKALTIVMDNEGIALSRRRITLSTAGVPINRKHPIKELLDACRNYPRSSNARRITFEYVMLKGVNDSPAEARQLVKLIAGIPAKVNLIPFNAWPGAPYECSTPEAIRKFAEIVNNAGYSSPVRTPRGRDILAACGQLKSESLRAKGQTLRQAQAAVA
jgi:23S rRNA (adenine2503-C2)-methyltransferase